MLKDIVKVEALENYRLHLWFEDNRDGMIDISEYITFSGVFEPLKDLDFFSQVRVDEELGTIFWPNGADLDPDVLYSLATGEELPDFEAKIMLIAEQQAKYE